jgi:hypothetical protein
MLLWLTEVLGDPTDGFAFYTLIFGAPLLMAIGLVLLASRKEVAGNAGLAGAILTLVGALFPDIIGFSLAIVGLLLLLAAVRDRARRLRPALGVLLVGIVGVVVRLEDGDGLVLFLPVIALGAAALAVLLQRLD